MFEDFCVFSNFLRFLNCVSFHSFFLFFFLLAFLFFFKKKTFFKQNFQKVIHIREGQHSLTLSHSFSLALSQSLSHSQVTHTQRTAQVTVARETRTYGAAVSALLAHANSQ